MQLTLYHGSKNIIEKPRYHLGNAHNDYGFGFYCAESLELAKEWASDNDERNGFANEYSLCVDGLRILDLTDERYSILNWMAVLLKYRTFDLNSEISLQAKKYLLKNFYIDVSEYDVIIGYRADDSYFAFARDFINNTISVRQLSHAMELGELGKQIVVVSELAFSRLTFKGFEMADRAIYFAKRKARGEKARMEYFKKTRKSAPLSKDLFVIDIMRKGLKNGDSII